MGFSAIFRAIALMAISLIGGIIGYWSTDTVPPVVVGSAEPTTPVVAPGGTLKIRFQIERQKSCSSTIERILLDGDRVRFVFDEISFHAAAGPLGHDSYAMLVKIPQDAAPGQAQFRMINTFYCNPIHRIFWPITATAPLVDFIIAGEPTKDGGEDATK